MAVLSLLWTAAWLFKWGCITTNLIEGRISQIKLRLTQRGRTSEEVVRRRLEVILSEGEPFGVEDEAYEPLKMPSLTRLGFINLGVFFQPEIGSMEVIRA